MHATRTRPEVKPTRKAPRADAPFGSGLFASMPAYRAAFTIEDEAWYVVQRARDEDNHFDQLAGEAEAQDRLERGICF